jgi:hypothetical protein
MHGMFGPHANKNKASNKNKGLKIGQLVSMLHACHAMGRFVQRKPSDSLEQKPSTASPIKHVNLSI